ncbi:MAG: substrate-binding domain-containing protein [Verrucomicrobiaceae bacterium]|nr:substrate-binding domain-containing protein [Verrucomicrobiaceae bacterium]NCF92995.1 substrate-binding domain-containing protein [Verrucomicrobiaceae bacterium]
MGAKHEEISATLRDEILSGRYGSEGKLPSEAQLVKRFDVSRPTIGRALRTLTDQGLIERRAGSGSYVNVSASETAINSKRIFALMMPDFGNTEIFQLISGEITSLARVHDYSIMRSGSTQPHADTDLSMAHAEELCRQFIANGVSGVFFTPYELVSEREEVNQWLVINLKQAGIPVVLIDRDLKPYPLRSEFDVVGVDNIEGGYLLGEHLIKLGSQRLRFVAQPGSAPTVNARCAGVREALVRHGKSIPQNLHAIGDLTNPKFIGELMKDRPDAFICANDHTAAQLLQSLSRSTINVPDKVRVVGFDDVKFATLMNPSLTTIQQPCREIAETAFRAMIERQSDPSLPGRLLTLAPRLIVRDSCGAYASP